MLLRNIPLKFQSFTELSEEQETTTACVGWLTTDQIMSLCALMEPFLSSKERVLEHTTSSWQNYWLEAGLGYQRGSTTHRVFHPHLLWPQHRMKVRMQRREQIQDGNQRSYKVLGRLWAYDVVPEVCNILVNFPKTSDTFVAPGKEERECWMAGDRTNRRGVAIESRHETNSILVDGEGWRKVVEGVVVVFHGLVQGEALFPS